MSDLIKQITGDLQKQIEGFNPELNVTDIGVVLEAGDGIARVKGLANVKAQELVQFSNGVMGTAFNLEKDSVGVIVMGASDGITEGMTVRGTNRIASVPVGDALIGRVVNALGCLLYTSDAADERSSVDLGGRRIIKKKNSR